MRKIDNQTFFDEKKMPSWENPPMVIAWQFSNAENLGALLRVCDNFGVRQVFFVGDATNHKFTKIKRNATTSINKIDWSFIEPVQIWSKIPKETVRIAVDTTTASIPINQYNFKPINQSFCFFFGNESIGLENEVISKCNTSIHIPMLGNSLSMNVVQAASIALYEVSKQRLL